jgi:uncharacterized protein YyaL (SSP411 family)
VPNQLAAATSPYLLQHADNPVEWHQWGAEAFALAVREDKPVLLSVGYAACHWCHVMAHESFEDADTAALMNALFVNIKVDREERPDVDAVYMQAVQSMTGQGGWPMTVFLTPAGEPFYAGTYFPPRDGHGLPSFRRVLQSVADSYRTRRAAIDQTAAALRTYYAAAAEPAVASGPLGPAILDRAYQSIARRFDARAGGFEGAPKFPQAMTLDFCLRYWRRTGTAQALDMTSRSFAHMARGGIYDQVGGGFHRYAVDAEWLVPHFEKMLYDNALLGRLGVHLWQATRDPEVRRATESTFDWVAREMTSLEGGFYASLDADSEGHEGTFYIWDDGELDALLSPELKAYYGVRRGGNFEGQHILHIPGDPRVIDADVVEDARSRLLAARGRRVRPSRDDKIIASWNGLMLRALTDGARAFGRPEYRGLAMAAGQFLVGTMVEDGGRVLRTWTNGVAGGRGVLEDHAAVALGFLGLYELTFDRVWLHRATTIAHAIGRHFWDDRAQAFFDTADDAEPLITRPRDVTDNAVPAGTSLAVDLLLQLGDLTDDRGMRERAEWVLTTMAEPMAQHGPAFGYLLNCADQAIHGSTQVALVGEPATPEFRELDAVVAMTYVPALVLAGGPPSHDSGVVLLDGRPAVDGLPTAYVCHGYVCDRPVTDAGALATALGDR